jgi:hypothetical protein
MLRPYLMGAPALRFDSNVRVTVDGNSIYAGFSTASIASLLVSRTALSGATFVSTAISGQTWRQMDGLDTGSSADVDTSIATAGKINILVCGEGTNAVDPAKSNLDGPGVVSAVTTYIANRKTANSKVFVVLCSALPRGPFDASNVAINTALNFSDAAFLANPSGVGAHRYANMRGYPAFSHNGFTLANFEAFSAAWSDSPNYVHPTLMGVAAMVDRIESALLAIRAADVQVT